ncbi:ArsB/NhaD family transporter [Aureibacter tunicatorum]|uniref:Na+/H+ antiporter NhaD/arsenite permease-like protein n=1 Tax=Aureibacter tunicatorum TaxID=866807 RepID=A0AAE4BTX4_9BACT|nr:SLC13 family permease [Aureibacter tunicatorum]MDR6240117.1 Na+/H+ antiporter NhaD/arsenite permease-like protein [Aureibacter tunicatorum]BDD06002.1 anion transporter [Aureibacter tunicatorum]
MELEYWHNAIIYIVVIVVYIGLAAGKFGKLKLDRSGIALLGAIVLLATGALTLQEAIKSINFPSLIILFGLMTISSHLELSGFYHFLAKRISFHIRKPSHFIPLLILSTGIFSALINNDIVCIAFTPILTMALISKKKEPIPYLIALALASNIGCGLTLIGNAQSVVIGEVAHLSFARYSLWAFLPVFLSLISCVLIVKYLHKHSTVRRKTHLLKKSEVQKIPFNKKQSIKGAVIVFLLVLAFLFGLPRYLSALVASGLILLNQDIKSKKILNGVNWQLLILFSGLFILMAALQKTHFPEQVYSWFEGKGVILEKPWITSLFTGVLGNFMNNAAGFILILQIIEIKQVLSGYVIALSNAFSGNLFLTSSVANIIVANEAKKLKVNITFREFLRYGIPVTLASFSILLFWIYITSMFL